MPEGAEGLTGKRSAAQAAFRFWASMQALSIVKVVLRLLVYPLTAI
jgi:hypothetical protein